MKPSSLILLASLALAAPSVASAQEPSGTFQQRASQLGAELGLSNVDYPDSGVQWGRAEGVVESRPEDVLAVLSDYSGYAGFFPYFKKSKVLSQRGSDAIVYLEAKVLHGAATLWSQVRMRASDQNETRVFEARMMRGKGNITQLLARWEVTPIDGGARTYVVFQILVDPDLPLPDMAVNSELKRGAGQAVKALRKRVYQRVSLASRTPTAT
jgi:ribosome-associated toxin RatA of RatAB toxin-antitoxin module